MHEYHIDTFVMGDDWKGKFDFLKEEGVENVKLSIVDRGALECTLRARLETLIGRAREEAANA